MPSRLRRGAWRSQDARNNVCGVDPHCGKLVPYGGSLCCYEAPPVRTANDTYCPLPLRDAPRPDLPTYQLFDVESDPMEMVDLASARPETVAALMARLDHYNTTSVPCCVCNGDDHDEAELSRAPKEGYWSTFWDQSPNPDPNCQLQEADR